MLKAYSHMWANVSKEPQHPMGHRMPEGESPGKEAVEVLSLGYPQTTSTGRGTPCCTDVKLKTLTSAEWGVPGVPQSRRKERPCRAPALQSLRQASGQSPGTARPPVSATCHYFSLIPATWVSLFTLSVDIESAGEGSAQSPSLEVQLGVQASGSGP